MPRTAEPTVYDFHSHTFHSDGCLSPVELIRRAVVNGYRVIGVTDHVGLGNCEDVLRQVIRDCAHCERYWGIRAIPGVEITHVPAEGIAEVAKVARAAGARLVLVHGETLVEPVEPGTNLAAVSCPDVDVLAHPGMLSTEEARIAAANGVFVEVSARGGHGLGNGNTVLVARAAGARLIVDSDSHEPGDLLTAAFARHVALGAGLREDELETVLAANPEHLLRRIANRSLDRA
jgi:putative hydrolase